MKKTLEEVCFSGKLTGDKATITILNSKGIVNSVSMTLGTEEPDMEIAMMVSRVQVGILGRSMTGHEEFGLKREMVNLIEQHNNELQDCRQDKPII